MALTLIGISPLDSVPLGEPITVIRQRLVPWLIRRGYAICKSFEGTMVYRPETDWRYSEKLINGKGYENVIVDAVLKLKGMLT